jgi:hypothetical protein
MSRGPTTFPAASDQPAPPQQPAEPPFAMNEVRLNARQWLIAAAIVLAFILLTPRAWKKIERFDTGPDYRIPYALSKDYWLWQRRVEGLNDPAKVVVLGDSVVWGEYVRPDGTLSHFLNAETGQADRFVNCGVNGLFPLALEGLVENYGGALRNRKVIVHCNLLWMSSPKADLRVETEESFNHSRLVPQFSPRIPCYKADAAERLSVLIEHHVSFSSWVGHIQDTYFDQRSIPSWTLATDGGNPPQRSNAWRNPFAQVTLTVPGEPADDPLRGPRSSRHKPWNSDGSEPGSFDWVDLDTSLQWQAFQRCVNRLRNQGNDVLVLVGPFNEHIIAPEQRPTYRAMRDGVSSWLQRNGVAHVVPETLPSDLYADDCHPLTDGYASLSRRVYEHPRFKEWLVRRDSK